MKRILPYNPKLKQRASELRKNSTLSEVLLWNQLKNKKMKGYDFHRQKPIDEYIVDFFCSELMLAIEIDGRSHDGKYEYDKKRQEKIESFDVHFLRFSDEAIKKRMNAVLKKIQWWIEEQNNTPRPKGHPSQEGNFYTPRPKGHPSQEGNLYTPRPKGHPTRHARVPRSQEGNFYTPRPKGHPSQEGNNS